MATPGEKLAESLEKLRASQDSGVVGIKADDFTRVHRERMLTIPYQLRNTGLLLN